MKISQTKIERAIREGNKSVENLKSSIEKVEQDKTLTKWTKIMAISIVIQTITLIVINILK